MQCSKYHCVLSSQITLLACFHAIFIPTSRATLQACTKENKKVIRMCMALYFRVHRKIIKNSKKCFPNCFLSEKFETMILLTKIQSSIEHLSYLSFPRKAFFWRRMKLQLVIFNSSLAGVVRYQLIFDYSR